MEHVLFLFLCLRGRYNFMNLSRWGLFSPGCYEGHFRMVFDWLGFNTLLVNSSMKGKKAIALDPSYLPKSGKKTAGLGRFYSGCAGRTLWGLEIMGLAAIDLESNTSLHLEAIQTVAKKGGNLLEVYGQSLLEIKDRLQKISSLLLADAYFSRGTFINPMCAAGFDVVTRLAKNAHIRYLYTGPKTGKKGRPRQYDGQLNPLDIDTAKAQLVKEDKKIRVWTLKVNIRAWKRNVSLVVVQHLDGENKPKTAKMYVSTDMAMTWKEILDAYSSRFQIEFLFRDAKQHTGLTNCQARSEEQIHFHVNASLTAVSIAKAQHLNDVDRKDKPFSMASIKSMNANALIFDKIIAMFPINPKTNIISAIRKKIIQVGAIAA